MRKRIAFDVTLYVEDPFVSFEGAQEEARKVGRALLTEYPEETYSTRFNFNIRAIAKKTMDKRHSDD